MFLLSTLINQSYLLLIFHSLLALVFLHFIVNIVIFLHQFEKYVEFQHAAVCCCRARGADPQSLVYEKPYCRIAPYLVGMMLGYLLLQTKDWNTSRVRCNTV